MAINDQKNNTGVIRLQKFAEKWHNNCFRIRLQVLRYLAPACNNLRSTEATI